ncbi:hypothetical protein MSG28_005182 [Choristoneura fumiferana]|uniref:Uncharacterized protein n=1 Tax=Choristoneura fumiferana TaxID=7141 RepID=A0ACC0JQI7_CHOFU|nr:hypothetical protein MSG28_005182 [Choristoneura fumiferana]
MASVKRSIDGIRALCKSADIVALQETWLLPFDLSFLSTIDKDFGWTGKLAVDVSAGLLKGRPHGGVAILWRKRAFNVAFDRVNYDLLWQKLSEAGIPEECVALFRHWYSNQLNRVRWASSLSSEYRLECGVRQGGITSPKLFNLYINGLIDGLSSMHAGCYVGSICVNSLSYADDMVLLCPSVSALEQLLARCEAYALTHGLEYNTKKSHVVTEDLNDASDIERERRALAVRGKMIARRFARCSKPVKVLMRLPRFCASAMFEEQHTNELHAIMHKKVSYLLTRVQGNGNEILRTWLVLGGISASEADELLAEVLFGFIGIDVELKRKSRFEVLVLFQYYKITDLLDTDCVASIPKKMDMVRKLLVSERFSLFGPLGKLHAVYVYREHVHTMSIFLGMDGLRQKRRTPELSAVTAIWLQLSLLDHCGCKSGSDTMRCGCRRVSLPCTAQCKSCKGGCTNQKVRQC